MANDFLPGSFTKEFGWNTRDLQKLHGVIREGFANSTKPIIRSDWRKNTGLNDHNRELIPLNFFLFSEIRDDDDYVLVDELVHDALSRSHDRNFDLLALFALHLGNNGNWRHKDSGRTDWQNCFITKCAWQSSAWARGAFDNHVMMNFINTHVEATDGTKKKIKNNYHYILEISGVFDGILNQPIELHPERWGEKACKLFWDRLTYNGSLSRTATEVELKDEFSRHEIFKLFGCSASNSNQIVDNAARSYIALGGVGRF